MKQKSVRAADGKLALLKEALIGERSTDRNRQRQRELMQRVCLLPEHDGLAPEQFVLSVKHGLNAAASDLGIDLGPERQRLISRLVSISIEEFFAVTDGNGTTPSRSGRGVSHFKPLRGNPPGQGDVDCRGI
ncbi:MAG TPA: hypothetical protein VHL12_06105 [Gemmatimonadaceae bacterium]|nr:hypothetical protein [Gemmatimonadaceae bacterium]